MSKNPLQVCRIQLEPYEVGVEKRLDLGVGGRSVVYGQAVRPRIAVQPGALEQTLHQHQGDVHAALKLSDGKGEQTRFVTVGADREVVIWNLHGKPEGQLTRQRKPILGLWELSNNRLVTFGADKRLIVWDLKTYKPLVRIRTLAPAAEHILVATTGDWFCVTERWWRTRIITMQGLTVAVFRPQTEPLTAIRRLRSGAFITVGKAATKLWNAQGMLLSQLPTFSLDDGYVEFPDPQYRTLIVDDQHQVHVLRATGGRLGSRAADEPLAKDLRKYLKCHAEARKALSDTPTHAQFGFRDNPFCDLVAPGEEPKKLTPKKDVPGPDSPWHFFHRPRHEAIQSWLSAEVKAANDAGGRVNNAIRAHQVAARLAQTRALLAWASLSPSTLVLIVCTAPAQLWAALFAGLASIGCALWMKREAKIQMSAERALSGLPRHIAEFLLEVETARAGMRAALPCVQDTGLYFGEAIGKRIEQGIKDTLIQTAFDACELKERDLITVGSKPIILRDWSLLVVPDDPAYLTPSLRAFWWTPEHGFFVAVERIQIVLPTFDVLYVFNVDYDFAADRGYNPKLHVFYYRDVANVIIRDALRSLKLPEGSTTVAAKEMQITMTSGESALIGALHQTSAHTLRTAAQTAVGPSNDNRKRNLETELLTCGPAGKRFLQAELAALEAESLTVAAKDDDKRAGVGDAMNYIKQLILWRKDPPVMPAPGIRPPQRTGPRPQA